MISFLRILMIGAIFLALAAYVLTAHRWQQNEKTIFESTTSPSSPSSTQASEKHWSQINWESPIWEDNASCLACHPAHAAEWEQSIHRLSFIDPLYRQQVMTQGGDFDCLACHLSQPVFESDLGSVPPARENQQTDGVSCLTCHVQNQRVIGRQTRDEVPCRPLAHQELTTAQMCHGCHKAYGKINTLHEYDEWLLRAPENKDKHCQDCHMEKIKRPLALGLSPAWGRHHGFEVRGNARLFNQFFEARIEKIKPHKFELVLENKGTAHRFPTGYTIKTVVLIVRGHLKDAEDGPSTIMRYELRKASPFGGTSTQLDDMEIRRLELPDLSEYSEVELVCLYKPYLLFLDSEVEPFYQKRIQPKNL